MFRSTLLVAVFTVTALAAPTTQWTQWTPALGAYYEAVSKYIGDAKASTTWPTAPSCNINNATLPTAPTPLPSPTGLTLTKVAIGRGVQNYTCSLASASVAPVAIGAVASLYDITCSASQYPELCSMLPNVVLQYPLPAYPTDPISPPQAPLIGHHYFSDPTTPIFDLNVDASNPLGKVVAHKVANSTAPAGAPLGPSGTGNGAVAWLYLNTTNATTGNIKAVYRVETAGGSQPKTCATSPAVFTEQYAAQYWFFS